MNVIETINVSKIFGGLVAVDDVNITIPEKTISSIIGPNGAGKTTLFNCLSGFYTPEIGEVLFMGESIKGLPTNKIADKGIARTYQNIRLFSAMTALENVMVGQTVNLKTNFIDAVFHTPRYHREEQKAIEKGLAVIDYVGLSGMGDWMATSMPYGAQRRLEIARAIASDPTLILLDEPTAGMNPQETVEMIDLIRRLRDDLGITVLMIEHDMKVIMEISEQISVIDFGQKIAEGVPEEIQNNKRVIEAYLGPGAAALSEKFQKERKEKSNGK